MASSKQTTRTTSVWPPPQCSARNEELESLKAAFQKGFNCKELFEEDNVMTSTVRHTIEKYIQSLDIADSFVRMDQIINTPINNHIHGSCGPHGPRRLPRAHLQFYFGSYMDEWTSHVLNINGVVPGSMMEILHRQGLQDIFQKIQIGSHVTLEQEVQGYFKWQPGECTMSIWTWILYNSYHRHWTQIQQDSVNRALNQLNSAVPEILKQHMMGVARGSAEEKIARANAHKWVIECLERSFRTMEITNINVSFDPLDPCSARLYPVAEDKSLIRSEEFNSQEISLIKQLWPDRWVPGHEPELTPTPTQGMSRTSSSYEKEEAFENWWQQEVSGGRGRESES